MQIAPQTKANEIIAELNEIRDKGHYLAKDQFVWKKLEREINQVKKIDPMTGWILSGMACSVAGDYNGVDYCFRNAFNLHPDTESCINMMTTYASLGLRTKVAELYRIFGNPENGYFSSTIHYGLGSGAFQKTAENINIALKMGLEMNGLSEIIETARSAAEILSRHNISDEVIAKHLDVAGQIFRDLNKFDLSLPQILVEKESRDIALFELRVSCSPSELFFFNVALAKKEEEFCIIKNPVFDVVFSVKR